MYITIGLLRLAHFLVLLFIVGAWFYPSALIWKLHLIFVPLIILQWRLNQDRCVFTNVELWLRKIADMPDNTVSEPGIFIKSVLSICLTPLPQEKNIARITYGSMLLSCGLSLLRLSCS